MSGVQHCVCPVGTRVLERLHGSVYTNIPHSALQISCTICQPSKSSAGCSLRYNFHPQHASPCAAFLTPPEQHGSARPALMRPSQALLRCLIIARFRQSGSRPSRTDDSALETCTVCWAREARKTFDALAKAQNAKPLAPLELFAYLGLGLAYTQ